MAMIRRCVVGLSLLLSLLPSPRARAELSLRSGADAIEVATGAYRWTIATRTFDVVHAATANGQPRLGPGAVSIDALGGTSTFGAPSEVTSGRDWIELRGWADQPKHLWYVARYQFFDGKPYARLVLTVTDRHDQSPAAEPWDKYWQDRVWSKWRLTVRAANGHPASVTQHNSYSWSSPGGPWIDVVGVNGSPYQWTTSPKLESKTFQLVHNAKDGANQIVWHPAFAGTAELTALITPFRGGADYHAARSATYEIVDATGRTQTRIGDQRNGAIKLGRFTLSKDSVVRLKATGGGEEIVVAGALRVEPPRPAAPFEVKPGARHDGVLADGPVAIAVKDFWQHHPMSLVRTGDSIGWQAIERPERYTGGMGLTIETMLAIDGTAAAAATALYEPPRRDVPKWLSPIEGSMTKSAVGDRYDALIKTFASRYFSALDAADDFGWRNWGDYQIGASYANDKGEQIEDWGNLQYDLPTGLLLAWMRTGDPALWRFAQASVRHLMDLDLVKFYPFKEKLDGLVYRKGEMPRSRSHVGAEPITDYGYAFRSLLLYHHLTGEKWALDLAKQNIDRLVYYAETRPQFVLLGGRPTGWMLRAALAGAQHFPNDPSHKYQAVADGIVAQVLGFYKANGRLPGGQPVWMGQLVESLAEYHRRSGRADVGDAIVGYVRSLLTDHVRKKSDGTYEFRYCLPGEKECAPEWTDEDNYLFLWLSGIEYAYHLSHDPFFAKAADALFAYGEARMKTRSEVRPWTSVLGYAQYYVDDSRTRR